MNEQWRKRYRITTQETGYAFDPDDDLERWDYWVFSAGHTFPGQPRKPMYDYIWMNGCNKGFRMAYERLCLPYSRCGFRFRSYNGYEMVSVSLLSDEEANERSPKFRENIQYLIENYEQLWEQVKKEMLQWYDELKNLDWEKATDIEVMDAFNQLLPIEERMWEHHMYFMDGLGAIYLLFRDMCQRLFGFDDKSKEFQTLMSGFDTQAFKFERERAEFAKKAEQKGLKEIIVNNPPDKVLEELEKSEKGAQWVRELKDWLWQGAGWLPTRMFEFCEPNWIERIDLSIEIIQRYLKEGYGKLEEKREKKVEEREKLEKELLAKVPIGERETFQLMMRMAQKNALYAEDHDFFLDMHTAALGRFVCLKVGERLVKYGCMNDPEDIFYLYPPEVNKILMDPPFFSAKATIERRKKEYEEACKNPPPPFIGKISLEEAGMRMAKAGCASFTLYAVGEVPVPKPELKADFIGTPVSGGIAEGRACVAFTKADLKEVKKGDILVCPQSFPDWNFVWPDLVGAVSEKGGMLTHTAIVSREYGVPCVVNAMGVLEKVKTGERIKIDGNLGAVWILD